MGTFTNYWLRASLLTMLACHGMAQASDSAVITAGSGSGTQGVVAINMAAGNFNQQINSAAFAANQQGASLAQVYGTQHLDNVTADITCDIASCNAETIISDGAFRDAIGWISINQASGTGNAQANGMAIALSINGVSLADSELGAALPDAVLQFGTGASPSGTRNVTLDTTTFQGASGLVQVNQAAGSWNRTANNFALNVSVNVAVP